MENRKGYGRGNIATAKVNLGSSSPQGMLWPFFKFCVQRTSDTSVKYIDYYIFNNLYILL